jgi:hypothetical protein
MANYYGMTKSNYFKVNDIELFKTEAQAYPVEVFTVDRNGVELVSFVDNDENEGNVDSYYDEESDEYIDVDWLDVFRRHLADNWVAIIEGIGNEKYRYFQGYAVAYNNKGEVRSIGINSINDLARDLGDNQ